MSARAAVRWAWGLLSLGIVPGALLLVVLAGWLGRRADSRPRLVPGTPVAEALGWPWRDFPRVTRVERDAIAREFALDEPTMIEDVRPWTPPLRGPLAPARAQTAQAVSQAEEVLRALTSGMHDTGTSEPGSELARFHQAEAALNAAIADEPSLWAARYDRGVLHLMRHNLAGAVSDLERAAGLLSARRGQGDDARLALEAAIHTHYALGVAHWRRGPAARGDAIRHLRAATQLAGALWTLRPPEYAHVPNALSFFSLRSTGLSTEAVAGDLIGAYLGGSGYHDCPAQPTSNPCYGTIDAGACAYRDQWLCKSFHRRGAAGVLGDAFGRLLEEFYAGRAWDREHRLWALSNMVDRAAQNVTGATDPRLVHNMACVALEAGEFEVAARMLDDALQGRVPGNAAARLGVLHVVAKVLAGREAPAPSAMRAAAGGVPSSVRARFLQMYGERAADDVSPLAPAYRPFPEVRAAVSPASAALLDRWLFLRLWRTLLQQGDFEGFRREFTALVEGGGVFVDFFRQWHDEAVGDLGTRALSVIRQQDDQGQRDRAAVIAEFLARTDGVPAPIRAEAAGRAGWRLRQPWTYRIGQVLALVAALWLLAYGIALVGTARRTFYSRHRVSRKGSRHAACAG